MLDWSALFSALALVFVIEGLMLLVGPGSMKKMYAEAATLEHKKLRSIGLGAIIVGILLLYFIR